MIEKRTKKRTKKRPVANSETKKKRRPIKTQQKTPRRVRRNVGKMVKDLEATAFSGQTYKFPSGLTKMRIIMQPGSERWYAPVIFGYIPTAEGKKVRVVSPKSADSEAYCPLMETFSALKRMGKTEESQEVRPTSRYLVHAMVRNDSGTWERKKIELPQTVWEPIARSDVDALEPSDIDEDGFATGGGIADPKTGPVINVRRTGEGANTKYGVTIGTKAIPAKREWMEKLTDLESETIPSAESMIEEALCEYLGIGNLEDLTGTPSSEKDDDYEDDEDDVGDDDDDYEDEDKDEDEYEDDDEYDDDDDEYEDD